MKGLSSPTRHRYDIETKIMRVALEPLPRSILFSFYFRSSILRSHLPLASRVLAGYSGRVKIGAGDLPA